MAWASRQVTYATWSKLIDVCACAASETATHKALPIRTLQSMAAPLAIALPVARGGADDRAGGPADEARTHHLPEAAAGYHADAGAERTAGHRSPLGRRHAFATGDEAGGDKDRQDVGLEHVLTIRGAGDSRKRLGRAKSGVVVVGRGVQPHGGSSTMCAAEGESFCRSEFPRAWKCRPS